MGLKRGDCVPKRHKRTSVTEELSSSVADSSLSGSCTDNSAYELDENWIDGRSETNIRDFDNPLKEESLLEKLAIELVRDGYTESLMSLMQVTLLEESIPVNRWSATAPSLSDTGTSMIKLNSILQAEEAKRGKINSFLSVEEVKEILWNVLNPSYLRRDRKNPFFRLVGEDHEGCKHADGNDLRWHTHKTFNRDDVENPKKHGSSETSSVLDMEAVKGRTPKNLDAGNASVEENNSQKSNIFSEEARSATKSDILGDTVAGSLQHEENEADLIIQEETNQAGNTLLNKGSTLFENAASQNEGSEADWVEDHHVDNRWGVEYNEEELSGALSPICELQGNPRWDDYANYDDEGKEKFQWVRLLYDFPNKEFLHSSPMTLPSKSLDQQSIQRTEYDIGCLSSGKWPHSQAQHLTIEQGRSLLAEMSTLFNQKYVATPTFEDQLEILRSLRLRSDMFNLKATPDLLMCDSSEFIKNLLAETIVSSNTRKSTFPKQEGVEKDLCELLLARLLCYLASIAGNFQKNWRTKWRQSGTDVTDAEELLLCETLGVSLAICAYYQINTAEKDRGVAMNPRIDRYQNEPTHQLGDNSTGNFYVFEQKHIEKMNFSNTPGDKLKEEEFPLDKDKQSAQTAFDVKKFQKKIIFEELLLQVSNYYRLINCSRSKTGDGSLKSKATAPTSTPAYLPLSLPCSNNWKRGTNKLMKSILPHPRIPYQSAYGRYLFEASKEFRYEGEALNESVIAQQDPKSLMQNRWNLGGGIDKHLLRFRCLLVRCEIEKKKERFEEAIELYKELINIWRNLGGHDQAQYFAEEGYLCSKKLGRRSHAVEMLLQIGECNELADRMEHAGEAYRFAMKKAVQDMDHSKILTCMAHSCAFYKTLAEKSYMEKCYWDSYILYLLTLNFAENEEMSGKERETRKGSSTISGSSEPQAAANNGGANHQFSSTAQIDSEGATWVYDNQMGLPKGVLTTEKEITNEVFGNPIGKKKLKEILNRKEEKSRSFNEVEKSSNQPVKILKGEICLILAKLAKKIYGSEAEVQHLLQACLEMNATSQDFTTDLKAYRLLAKLASSSNIIHSGWPNSNEEKKEAKKREALQYLVKAAALLQTFESVEATNIEFTGKNYNIKAHSSRLNNPKSMKKHPVSIQAQVYLELGLQLEANGDSDQAEEYLVKSCDIASRSPENQNILMRAKIALGEVRGHRLFPTLKRLIQENDGAKLEEWLLSINSTL